MGTEVFEKDISCGSFNADVSFSKRFSFGLNLEIGRAQFQLIHYLETIQ